MIEPEAKPDADYTTQQAADRCGMSINTLLAWERRYGVPSPRRNERDERIYTEADLRVIRWLKDETARGTPIGQAVLLLPETNPNVPPVESSSEDVVVALDLARGPEQGHRSPDVDSDDLTQAAIWRRDLFTALREFDRVRVATILGNVALASSPLLATEQVVVPTMHSIATDYVSGKLDLAVVDAAERWLSARISQWFETAMPAREHARAIAVLLASDTPWSSVQTLAIALRRAGEGYHLIDLPSGCPAEAIQAVVKQVGASEVIAIAHDAGDRRALRARLNLLRSILPTAVTLTLLDDDHHASPGSQSIHNDGASTHLYLEHEAAGVMVTPAEA